MKFIENIRTKYRSELFFYTKYHSNSVNIGLHVVCVPLEWLSFLVVAAYVNLHITLSLLIAGYYLLLDSNAKIQSSITHVVLALVASLIYNHAGSSKAWIIALAIQAVAWTAQVGIGHYFFEQNSPAMKDKLTANSIVLSVLLAWENNVVDTNVYVGLYIVYILVCYAYYCTL